MRGLRSAAQASVRRCPRPYRALVRRLHLQPAQPAARRLPLCEGGGGVAAGPRGQSDPLCAARPAPRFHRGDRSRRVLRRGEDVHHARVGGVRLAALPRLPQRHQSRHHDRSLEPEHDQRHGPAAVRILRPERRALSRQRHDVLAGGPGGGGRGVRSQPFLHVHLVRGLRVVGHAAGRQHPPQRDLPQRAGAAAADLLPSDRRRSARAVVQAPRGVPGRGHRMRCAHHSAQRQPERRQAVRAAEALAGGRPPVRRNAAVLRAALRDVPAQGELGVPHRCGDGRSGLRLRADSAHQARQHHRPRQSAAGLGFPAQRLSAQRAQERAGPGGGGGRQPVQARLRGQHGHPQRGARRYGRGELPGPSRQRRRRSRGAPRGGGQQPRRPGRRLGRRELPRLHLRRHAPARDVRHQRHAAGGALLRRMGSSRGSVQPAGFRADGLCPRSPHGWRPAGGRLHVPQPAFRGDGPEGPRHRPGRYAGRSRAAVRADPRRYQAATPPDREGVGGRRRRAAREGLGRRRRSGQWRRSGPADLCADRAGAQCAVRGFRGPAVGPATAGFLLCPRPGEPDLPLEHAHLQTLRSRSVPSAGVPGAAREISGGPAADVRHLLQDGAGTECRSCQGGDPADRAGEGLDLPGLVPAGPNP